MSVLSDLQAAKASAAARLAEVLAEPQPDYSVGGQSVSWGAYCDMLTRQIENLNRLIQIEGGVVELRSSALT